MTPSADGRPSRPEAGRLWGVVHAGAAVGPGRARRGRRRALDGQRASGSRCFPGKRSPSGCRRQAAGAGSPATAVWVRAGKGEKDEGATERDPSGLRKQGGKQQLRVKKRGKGGRKMQA